MKIEELSVENSCIIIDIISGSHNCGRGSGSDTRGSTHSNPQRELCDSPPTGRNNSLPQQAFLDVLMKELILFAQRLAIIQKTEYGLDKLAFFWATAVLLGSYASALKPIDFWFVTIILIVKGPHILSLSSNLTQTHLATPSHLLPNDMLLPNEKRTWLNENVHLLPRWVLVPQNINYLFHLLQILGAATCVVLSLMRLGQQKFGEEAQNNQKSVLVVFYTLALAEALMFLLEKSYWTWKVQREKLFKRVKKELGFGPFSKVFVRLYFLNVYSKYKSGSIFDELKTDPISFAGELLNSNSLNDQINGAKILQQFVKDKRFSVEALHKIASSYPLIRRLIEMLDRRNPEEKDIRHSASQIFAKLTSQHVQLVVAEFPGAVESVASLLKTREMIPVGLHILKHISRNHVSCEMIQNKQDLLGRIIDLASSDAALLCNEQLPPELHIKAVRRELKVVKYLLRAIGDTGRALQRDISESKYLMSIVEISLKYGWDHPDILLLVSTILRLSEENEEVYKIKVLFLFELLFLPIKEEEFRKACNEIGEVLVQVARHSSQCVRILRATKDVLKRLVVALGNPVLRVTATNILGSLLAHSDLWSFDELQIVAEKMPMVLKTIMEEKENEKLLEASIGLARQILKAEQVKVFPNIIERAGIKDEDFVGRLVEIFRIYYNPNSEVSEMRKSVIWLGSTLMSYDPEYVDLLSREFKMDRCLMQCYARRILIDSLYDLGLFDQFLEIVSEISLRGVRMNWTPTHLDSVPKSPNNPSQIIRVKTIQKTHRTKMSRTTQHISSKLEGFNVFSSTSPDNSLEGAEAAKRL